MNEVNFNNNEFFEKFKLININKSIESNEIRLLLRDKKNFLFYGGAFEIIFTGDFLDDNQLFYFPNGTEKFYIRSFSDLKNIDYHLKNDYVSNAKITNWL
jgi:hypothetical protein